MEKYDRKDKTQIIYNVDEKVLQPNVVASVKYVPSALSLEKDQTTAFIIMGCGNALSYLISHYFVSDSKLEGPVINLNLYH